MNVIDREAWNHEYEHEHEHEDEEVSQKWKTRTGGPSYLFYFFHV